MTAIAVLLGVSMISGTFVFTDTIQPPSASCSPMRRRAPTRSSQAVRTLLADQCAGEHADFPRSTVRGLPAVADAQGQITDVASIVDATGK